MTASGQYIAQIPQRLHASRLTTGRNVLQEPVKPGLIIRLGISVISAAVQVVNALQEGISKCPICHPIKDFFYIHDMYLRNVFLDTTVSDK